MTSPSRARGGPADACRSSPAATYRPGKPDAAVTGDLVVRNIGRLTTWHGPVVEHAAVVIRGGHVEWTGPDRDLPAARADAADAPELDAGGAAVLPGFVDCHTHAVWAGSRRDDFVGRLSGEGYRPGGVAETVGRTRAATTEDLLALAAQRLRTMA